MSDTEKFKYTIPANSSVEVNAEGRRIYCEEATNIFYINVPGVQSYEMKAKRTRILDQPLKTFFLDNKTGAPNTVEIHIGHHEVYDNEFKIAGTITGDVTVVNSATVGKELLKVDDDQTQTAIGNVYTNISTGNARLVEIRDVVKNDKVMRAPLSTLLNATYAAIAGATSQTFVTAAANVNGIIIRRAQCNGENGNAILRLHTTLGLEIARTSGSNNDQVIENIFIPAGYPLHASTVGSQSSVFVWYEVL